MSDKQNVNEELSYDSDSSESSLDVTSSKFDPLKALYSPNMKIPVQTAPIYDNIAMFSTKMKAIASGSAGKTVVNKAALEKRRQMDLAAKNERRFQPHQMPVECKRTFVGRNILTRMENMQGPLGRLKTCMDSRIRIKVITRHHSGIRGYCIGYLHAFDKLWNLALSDVTEIWTRKRKKKIPAAIDALELTEQLQKKLSFNRPTPPKIIVKPAGKGQECCERHIPQLMMRGEHVVSVVILQEENPTAKTAGGHVADIQTLKIKAGQ